FWSVPPEEVPVGEEARIVWLYDWWARIDAWIEEHRPAPRPLSTDWTARRAVYPAILELWLALCGLRPLSGKPQLQDRGGSSGAEGLVEAVRGLDYLRRGRSLRFDGGAVVGV